MTHVLALANACRVVQVTHSLGPTRRNIPAFFSYSLLVIRGLHFLIISFLIVS